MTPTRAAPSTSRWRRAASPRSLRSLRRPARIPHPLAHRPRPLPPIPRRGGRGEGNRVLAERGHGDVRLLDNGAIGREMPAIEGPTHAYHLVPEHGQQGGRGSRPRPRPRLRPGRRASRSATRSRTSRWPPRSAASSSSPMGPSGTPACAPRSPPGTTPRSPRADGRRLLRGRRLHPGGGAGSTSIGPNRRKEQRCRRKRDRRRAGVPGDHVLAGGGRAADDRRQHRPRDAALAPDRARDDRPPGRGRLRRAQAPTNRSRSPSPGASTPATSSAATG